MNQCLTDQDENVSNKQMGMFYFPPDFSAIAPVFGFHRGTMNNNAADAFNYIPKQDHQYLKVSQLGINNPQLPLQRTITFANIWASGEELKGESVVNDITRNSLTRKEDDKYQGHIGVSSSTMKKKMIKAAGKRKMREPRFSFKTMSDIDVLDDGYKWRKYGQKVVKDTHHPRSYYRCTQDNCQVKKRVERLAEDPRMVITTYEGRHMHSPNPNDNNNDHIYEF